MWGFACVFEHIYILICANLNFLVDKNFVVGEATEFFNFLHGRRETEISAFFFGVCARAFVIWRRAFCCNTNIVERVAVRMLQLLVHGVERRAETWRAFSSETYIMHCPPLACDTSLRRLELSIRWIACSNCSWSNELFKIGKKRRDC